MQCDELLLPSVSVRIRMLRNRSAFTLISSDATDDNKYSIKIKECTLNVRRHVLLPSLVQRNYDLLREGAIFRMPMKKTFVRSFVVAKGSTSASNESILTSVIPNRFIIWMVC